MKKMYFFLSLCLAMIGLTANAQIASLSELSNEKCYAVSNVRTSWATSTTALKSINDLGLAADGTSPAQQFAFLTNDEGTTYYLYSVGQSKFVNLDGSLGNKPVNPINFKQSGSKFVMYFDGSHYINCGGSNQMIIDNWSIADDGNLCEIKEVADFDPTAALAKFNSVDEAEVAANLAKAEEVLAKVGVGYPTADCGTRAALVAAVDAVKAGVTAENANALSTALEAFMAETSVVLPESGKYYTFTMVAKNGNKFYLNYTGADVAMTPVTGEALPESAKFLATANGDGTYTFQTSDGNYLVYHTKYAGVNWLEGGGNTTGFQAEKDDMTNITLAKLSKGGNVAATTEQVFGLVSWYGKRGYNLNKNADEMGYMVLKTDGSDYDGAGAPFWNDNFSSAFLVEETEVAAVEPVLPLELVSVSPEDNANLSAFDKVVLTFNKPVTVVESDETGAILMFNGMPAMQLWTDLSEDGKSVTMHAGAPIDMVGTYGIYVMPGTFVDADGNLSEEMMFNYTVAGAADGFTYTYAAPTTDKVQSSLKNITLGFASAVATVKTDALNVVDGEGNVVTTATVAADDMDDQAVVVTLAEEVVYTGTYSLTVPAQFVTSALGTYNPEFTLTYTVEGLEKVDYTPRHTGAKSRSDRAMTSVKVGEQVYELTTEEQALCYIDATEKVTFQVEAGAEVTLEANTVASWIHNAVFVDTDANGFIGAIAEGSQYLPAGDLVAYSFYNNGSSSDASGWNSKGDVVTGDNRNRPALPAFTAPTTPGTYRMRFTQDWCSIDPAGDADGLFGDFMANGGQILDVLLEVTGAETPETPEVPNAELAETYTGTCNINFMGAPTEANVSLDFDKDSEGNAKAGYAYLLFSNVELGPVFNAEAPYEVKGNTVVLKGIEVATGENSDDTKEVDLTFTVQEDGKLLSNDQVYGPGFLSSILFDFSQCPLAPKSEVVDPETPEVPAGPVVITDVAQLSNAKCYTIVSSDTGRGGMYALADKVDMCGVTYNQAQECHGVARDNADPKQQFAFVAYEGKHYLYSVSEKKFVMKSGNTNALVGEAPFEFVTVEPVGENTFALKANDTHYFTASPGWCTNAERNTCIQSTLTSQSPNDGWDDGAWFTITEVGNFDATEAIAMLTPAAVEPTTVVAVDPACGNYEVMPATIKVTFSQEIGALTFSRIRTDIGSDAYTLTANDLNINGKEVSFTVPAQYVDGARNMLIMLAIEDTNGNPVSYSSNENTAIEGYVMLEYTADSKPAATPLELVSVSPADGAELESVSKFTFTFNKPVTLGAEGGVVLYVNGMPAGQLWGEVSEEDAKVVTFVTEKEISNSGKYMLYVAPATFVDADGNTNEEMMLNYQVKAAVNSFTYAYVTPAQHQVQKSLKVLTIGFIGEVQDVVSSKSINVVDAEGKTVTTAMLGLDDYDWNAVIVTFKDEITAPGKYSITIPEEYVYSFEQTYNPEFTLTFTIEGEKQPLEIVEVDPAKGSVIPAISVVKITFNQEVTVPKMFGNAKLYYNGTYFDDPALYVDKTDAKVVYIDIQSEYTNKATWSFEIKPGAILTLDGTPCEEILLSYEVGDITCINGISVEQMNDVYTLDGRKVVVTPGQKIKKGLYIVGGKKVLVK